MLKKQVDGIERGRIIRRPHHEEVEKEVRRDLVLTVNELKLSVDGSGIERIIRTSLAAAGSFGRRL